MMGIYEIMLPSAMGAFIFSFMVIPKGGNKNDKPRKIIKPWQN